MKDATVKRMRANLAKGVACLALGAVAVMAIELVWDHVMALGRTSAREQAGISEESGPGGSHSLDTLLSYVFDQGELADTGLPAGFIEDYFDPRGLGELSTSDDGMVVGIVSDYPAAALFGLCVDGLEGRGWMKLESGQALRCTFVREGYAARWVFLDVTQVSDSGVAVLVLEGRK